MFRHIRHTYKIAHAEDRVRFNPAEVKDFKKQVKNQVETKTMLSLHELKVLQEQNEKQIRVFEEEVTDAGMDKSYAVPVYNRVTGDRFVITPKEPHPIYYQEVRN